MGKLFGTDGIRGVANETLDAKLAYRVGQAAAISLADDSGTKPTVVIGKDTRISSDMLEGALVAGLTACGCNAILLGVIPTPAVAYLTVYLHADAGVVISASHNPYEHNGIKMFSSEGFKLSDALEARIEELILREGELPVKTHGQIGQVMSGSFAAEYYLDHLASTVEDLEPLRVLIDCANGAASTTARYLFGRFPLQAEYLNDKPNGVNINEWLRAAARLSDKAAVFIPWYESNIHMMTVTDPKGLCLNMDEYEQWLWDIGLSLEQIAWYDAKRREYSSHKAMMAEYPTTADEAFNSTERAVFDHDDVAALRQDCNHPIAVGEVYAEDNRGYGALRNVHFVPSA